MVFDNRLYYEKGSYRTPYILPILESNLLKNNQLEELILDKKGENIAAFPLKWRCGESNPPLFRTVLTVFDLYVVDYVVFLLELSPFGVTVVG